MKKIMIIILLLTPIVLMAQKGLFTLKGQIGKVNAPAKIYLSYRIGNLNVVDSATLQNGTFELKGSITAPKMATLSLNYTGSGKSDAITQSLPVYLESGVILISSPDSLSHIVIKGSKLNADNDKLKLALKPIDEKSAAIRAALSAIQKEKEKDTAVIALMTKKYRALRSEGILAYANFIKANPDSYVGLIILLQYGKMYFNTEELENNYNLLSARLKNTDDGKKLMENITIVKNSSVGKYIQNFVLPDPKGKDLSFSSLKGKYILLDFWASWCHPCRQSFPHMLEMYNKFQGQNFDIYSISIDKSKDAWLNAVEEDHTPWLQSLDTKDIAETGFAVLGVPTYFLIDPNGKIIAKEMGFRLDGDISKKLNELFGEKISTAPSTSK
jgi:thiol-disulfide isomerase/thioredoxin